MASKIASPAEEWMQEDNLMLLECWARDGYTLGDIANRIGIQQSTLSAWKKNYPEIAGALKKGKEIIDYKVENALLKSALGYKTKEVKVTTTIRYGKVVETVKEVIDKEQAPNVSAIQCWLYNRLPDKWKKNRDNIFDTDEEDATIHVTVTRASVESNDAQHNNNEEDEEWQDEINQSIEIRKATEEEIQQKRKQKKVSESESDAAKDANAKIEIEPEDDPDYWPDDWEDEDE